MAALCADDAADAVSVDHWGDVLAALGRRAEAAAAWRRAAAAFQAEGDENKSAQILRKVAAASRP